MVGTWGRVAIGIVPVALFRSRASFPAPTRPLAPRPLPLSFHKTEIPLHMEKEVTLLPSRRRLASHFTLARAPPIVRLPGPCPSNTCSPPHPLQGSLSLVRTVLSLFSRGALYYCPVKLQHTLPYLTLPWYPRARRVFPPPSVARPSLGHILFLTHSAQTPRLSSHSFLWSRKSFPNSRNGDHGCP